MPSCETSAPQANDGSAPASTRATTSIAVVVVLPLAPATATPRAPASRAARAWERCSTGRPAARAATSSGLSSRTAEETTTVSTPSRWAASWPTHTRGAGGAQRLEHGPVGRVGAADRHPAGEQQPGDGGHPRPADGDEVDGAEAVPRRDGRGEVEAGVRDHGSAPPRRTGDEVGEQLVAVALPHRRRGGRHRRRAGAGSRASGHDGVGDPRGVDRGVVDEQAAAGVDDVRRR